VWLKLNLVHMIWINGTYDMVAVQEEAKYGQTSGIRVGRRHAIRFRIRCDWNRSSLQIRSEARGEERSKFPSRSYSVSAWTTGINHLLFERVHERLLA
jgi:acetolactate synthase-1/2/3 large subunit